jgi:hypothetical protein
LTPTRKPALIAALIVAAAVVSGCALGIAGTPSYVTGTGASINGKAFSNTGGTTDYWVKYGKTTALGSETPHQSVDIDPEADKRGIVTSTFLEGLDLGTTYHYRLCAKDSQAGAGVGCDVDKTFTTAPSRQGLQAIPNCIPEPGVPFRLRDEGALFSVAFEGVVSIEDTWYADTSPRQLHTSEGGQNTVTVTAQFPLSTGGELPPAGSWILNWDFTGSLSEHTPLQIGNCGGGQSAR